MSMITYKDCMDLDYLIDNLRLYNQAISEGVAKAKYRSADKWADETEGTLKRHGAYWHQSTDGVSSAFYDDFKPLRRSMTEKRATPWIFTDDLTGLRYPNCNHDPELSECIDDGTFLDDYDREELKEYIIEMYLDIKVSRKSDEWIRAKIRKMIKFDEWPDDCQMYDSIDANSETWMVCPVCDRKYIHSIRYMDKVDGTFQDPRLVLGNVMEPSLEDIREPRGKMDRMTAWLYAIYFYEKQQKVWKHRQEVAAVTHKHGPIVFPDISEEHRIKREFVPDNMVDWLKKNKKKLFYMIKDEKDANKEYNTHAPVGFIDDQNGDDNASNKKDITRGLAEVCGIMPAFDEKDQERYWKDMDSVWKIVDAHDKRWDPRRTRNAMTKMHPGCSWQEDKFWTDIIKLIAKDKMDGAVKLAKRFSNAEWFTKDTREYLLYILVDYDPKDPPPPKPRIKRKEILRQSVEEFVSDTVSTAPAILRQYV